MKKQLLACAAIVLVLNGSSFIQAEENPELASAYDDLETRVGQEGMQNIAANIQAEITHYTQIKNAMIDVLANGSGLQAMTLTKAQELKDFSDAIITRDQESLAYVNARVS